MSKEEKKVFLKRMGGFLIFILFSIIYYYFPTLTTKGFQAFIVAVFEDRIWWGSFTTICAGAYILLCYNKEKMGSPPYMK